MSEDTQRAWEQAQAQLDSIKEMVEALRNANTDDYHKERDDALNTIQEDPLSVEVRSGWVAPGADMEPEEYMILLCTGGPAVRITGSLDQFFEPNTAKIEYQDWFTPWVEMAISNEDETVLLEYCREFYFSA
jgi:hypothetical protein